MKRQNPDNNSFTEKETIVRREAALARALNTSHKPHNPLKAKKKKGRTTARPKVGE